MVQKLIRPVYRRAAPDIEKVWTDMRPLSLRKAMQGLE
jgi:uncharacterized protein YbdZ (MbtH family)